jgi:cold shock protein
MATGVVKWFDTARGFGFIKPNDKGIDVFVHATALKRAGLEDLQDGQHIPYDLVQSPKTGKSSAENVRVLQRAAAISAASGRGGIYESYFVETLSAPESPSIRWTADSWSALISTDTSISP